MWESGHYLCGMPPIKPKATLLAEITASASTPTGTQDLFLERVWPIMECTFAKRGNPWFIINSAFITQKGVEDKTTYSFSPDSLQQSFIDAGYDTLLTGPSGSKTLRVNNPL